MPGSRLIRHMAGYSGVAKGAMYMTAAAFLFAIMNSLVRVASEGLPPLEVAFFRNLFAFASMLPWVLASGLGGLRTRHMKLHIVRAIVSTCSMGLWFTSIAHVPLAEAVALNFTMPIFIVAGAAVLLGEKVGLRRWSAIGLGFAGMLVILRPGLVELTPIMAFPVAAAFFMAISALLLKRISATDFAGTSVLYLNLLMIPLSLVPAFFVWVWPQPQDFVVLMALGLLATLAHLALARGFAAADASAVIAFDYARLPFIAFFAFVFFGEVPEIWTWVGGAIIAGSSIYIVRRENALARQKRADLPSPALSTDH